MIMGFHLVASAVMPTGDLGCAVSDNFMRLDNVLIRRSEIPGSVDSTAVIRDYTEREHGFDREECMLILLLSKSFVCPLTVAISSEFLRLRIGSSAHGSFHMAPIESSQTMMHGLEFPLVLYL